MKHKQQKTQKTHYPMNNIMDAQNNLDKLFPKGDKRRGQALLIFATAKIEGIEEGKKELYLEIVKKKFKGSVRDFLIWYGGKFKDVKI